MKKFISIFMSAILIILIMFSFSGCGKEKKEKEKNEDLMEFASEKEMAEYLDGTWDNDKNIIIISDGVLHLYNEDLDHDKLESLFCGEDALLSVDEQITLTADEYFKKYYTAYSLDYDIQRSVVLLDGKDLLLVNEDDTLTFLTDFDCVAKNDDVGRYDDDTTFPMDVMKDVFEATKKIYAFSNKKRGLPNNSDVQYDKSAYYNKDFWIYGDAEIDDYYTGNFRNMESSYFCIRITPLSGDYWFVYASRSEFSQLYEDLKTAGYSDKKIKLDTICNFSYSGSSSLTCELVDVDYNTFSS